MFHFGCLFFHFFENRQWFSSCAKCCLQKLAVWKKNLQRVRRESPQVLPLYRKSLKQASHQFHICIKFQWQVWTQWHGQRLSVWGWTLQLPIRQNAMQTARVLSWKKLVFVTNECLFLGIHAVDTCVTHFAICTRLSNPFAIQIFSWAWPRARSKNAVRERFTLGVRGATSIEQKLRGYVKLKYFNSTGSS